MNGRPEVEQAVQRYFNGVNNNDIDTIPLTDDAVMSGPMIPTPLRGEAEVRRHIAETAPFVDRLELKKMLIEGDSAAVILEFRGINGVVIQGAEFFQVRDGRLCRCEVFFDTRILIQGAR
jgi:hypothetical protein